MVNENRSGETTSLQVAKMGVLDCASGDFALNDGGDGGFLVKNDGAAPVMLKVRLLGMKDTDDLIETRFYVGWNPEIVRFVKQDANISNLKYGI